MTVTPSPQSVVSVEVSGLTGSGKSAVMGEIEIALKALGLTVEHDAAFQAEKNGTHADWQDALDLYKPTVVLTERTMSRAPAAPQAAGVGEDVEAIRRYLLDRASGSEDEAVRFDEEAIEWAANPDANKAKRASNSRSNAASCRADANKFRVWAEALRAPSREPEGGAVETVWRCAMTVACNIAIDEQNRTNDDDGPSNVLNAQGEIIRRLKGVLEIDRNYRSEVEAILSYGAEPFITAPSAEAALATREEAPAEAGEPCGGCGEANPMKRCVGCMHDFRAQPQARSFAPASRTGGEVMDLQPANQADFEMASDLGRKAGHDTANTMMRTVAIAQTHYQQEVIALSCVAAVITGARAVLQLGSLKGATDADLIAALVEMLPATPSDKEGGE